MKALAALARRSWLRPVFAVSDAELMRTAGLDALIFHRAYTFGILFFGPVTLLSCALRASLCHLVSYHSKVQQLAC